MRTVPPPPLEALLKVAPVVTDPTVAARWPELAVLSAMAHGQSEQGAAIAAAALPAILGLDDDRARFFGDLVLNSLNKANWRSLEGSSKGDEYLSELAKKYVAWGRAEEGAEGRAETRARDILTVLRARGIVVSDSARERILAQKDPERLERWLERALVAPSIAEVLDDPS
jgi:hypothetical protein